MYVVRRSYPDPRFQGYYSQVVSYSNLLSWPRNLNGAVLSLTVCWCEGKGYENDHLCRLSDDAWSDNIDFFTDTDLATADVAAIQVNSQTQRPILSI